jgi:hypothetical protein
MAFSGQWLKQNGPFLHVNMPFVHTADPRHAATMADDPNTAGYTAPAGVAQTGFGLPYDEWMGGTGVIIEYSPQEHNLGIGDNAYPSDPYIGATGLGGGSLTYTEQTMPVHDTSYGGEIAHVYNPAPMQFKNERYGTIRSAGFGPTLDNNSPTGWRGTYGNSSPANNPHIPGLPGDDGFPRGSDLMVVGVDRKFNIGERYHDRHVVSPNDATLPTNQVRPDGHSPYLSPFDTAKRAITRAWNTPAKLASPPDFSQDIVTEPPADDTVTAMPDWGFIG